MFLVIVESKGHRPTEGGAVKRDCRVMRGITRSFLRDFHYHSPQNSQVTRGGHYFHPYSNHWSCYSITAYSFTNCVSHAFRPFFLATTRDNIKSHCSICVSCRGMCPFFLVRGIECFTRSCERLRDDAFSGEKQRIYVVYRSITGFAVLSREHHHPGSFIISSETNSFILLLALYR